MTSRGPARTAPASSAPGAPVARCTAQPGRVLAAAALVALIGTACSNAPAGSGAATPGSPSTAGGTGGGGDQNAATESSPIPRENSLKFSACMRENGVQDFPDPDENGIIKFYGEPDPALFTSAQENCRHLRPRPEGQDLGSGG
jgi:hypothetical protein